MNTHRTSARLAMRVRLRPAPVAIAGSLVLAVVLAHSIPTSATEVSARPPCTITGTSGNDILRGTSGDDVICGLGGDDRIDGRGGDDVIYGGAGDDDIKGGPGADKLHGGAGDDDIKGGPGADAIDAGNGSNVTLRLRIRSASVKSLVLGLQVKPNKFNSTCSLPIQPSKGMPTTLVDPWLPQEFVLLATGNQLTCSGSSQPLYEFTVIVTAGSGSLTRVISIETGDSGTNTIVIGCDPFSPWKCQPASSKVVKDSLVMYIE